MAKESHFVNKILITGEEGSEQIILFADLTNDEGETVPDFDAAPWIEICSPRQDRHAKIVEGSITTTQFQVALSDLRGDSSTQGYFNFEIRGEPA